MKKSIVAILAVAIIGALGIYTKSQKTTASTILKAPDSTSSIATGNSSSVLPSTVPDATTASPSATSGYKDGTYTGASEETAYGTVQVAVVISGGQITDVKFLKMPSDEGHSQEVTDGSEPILISSTLKKQSANIDFVSGATQTSEGYTQSLQSALNQAM